jgi:hypothetical protein
MFKRPIRIIFCPSPLPSLPSFSLRFLLVLSAGLAVFAPLEAQQPSWSGDSGTTHAGYQFTTNAVNPPPEGLVNPYGTPSATISVSEPLGAGWQDPSFSFTISGVNADGAWDLGPDGSIAITLPMAPENADPGLFYRVEFYVYAVAYEIPVQLPVISAPGLSLENISSNSVIVKQDTLGRYKGITWTAEAEVLSGNTVTLLLAATSAGALIDSVDIYTRYTLLGEPTYVYDAWTTANFPDVTDPSIIGFEASPDSDGISNGLKYFLGRERNATGPVISIESADTSSMVFRHTRNKTGTPDVIGAYQWSSDLINWQADGENANGISVNFSSLNINDSNPDFDLIETTATVIGGASDRIFVRLLVTQLSE